MKNLLKWKRNLFVIVGFVLILFVIWFIYSKFSVTNVLKFVWKYQNLSWEVLYVSEYNWNVVLFKQVSKMEQNHNLQYFYFDWKMFEIQNNIDKVSCSDWESNLYEKCDINWESYTRKLFDPELWKTYKINPVMSQEDVKNLAMRSVFPFTWWETKLVDLEKLDSSLKIDIRYATDNNFMWFALYPDNKAFLEEKVANSLVLASQELHKIWLGIVVYDAYRPWYVTKMFWEATPEDKKDFVADPSKGSRHNRGYAVDIWLYDLKSWKYLEMPSGFDEFSERAYPEYIWGTTQQRNNRNILIDYMSKQWFVVNGGEWWHYDYNWRKDAPVLNLDFVDIK